MKDIRNLVHTIIVTLCILATFLKKKEFWDDELFAFVDLNTDILHPDVFYFLEESEQLEKHVRNKKKHLFDGILEKIRIL